MEFDDVSRDHFVFGFVPVADFAAEESVGVAELFFGFFWFVVIGIIGGSRTSRIGQRGFNLSDLGGCEIKKAINDFIDVSFDQSDSGSIGCRSCCGGTFRELRELGFVGGIGGGNWKLIHASGEEAHSARPPRVAERLHVVPVFRRHRENRIAASRKVAAASRCKAVPGASHSNSEFLPPVGNSLTLTFPKTDPSPRILPRPKIVLMNTLCASSAISRPHLEKPSPVRDF
ncbi:MAG: hypothetical protein Q8Q59_02335 [Luteolibacter sp.]|nr:hypothetical protein [Luteolibacter sp.]